MPQQPTIELCKEAGLFSTINAGAKGLASVLGHGRAAKEITETGGTLTEELLKKHTDDAFNAFRKNDFARKGADALKSVDDFAARSKGSLSDLAADSPGLATASKIAGGGGILGGVGLWQRGAGKEIGFDEGSGAGYLAGFDGGRKHGIVEGGRGVYDGILHRAQSQRQDPKGIFGRLGDAFMNRQQPSFGDSLASNRDRTMARLRDMAATSGNNHSMENPYA